MATKIQLRRDTAADWTSNNPTLAAGEFGWESDTNKFKIGDGSTAWTSLAYASDGDTAGITFVGDDSTGTLVSQNETFKVAGTQNVTTAVSGDTLTVTGPDLSSYATGSSTTTFTNKTFDANGTGNSISNIETADIAAGTLVTAAEGIGSNDNDTTIPTSAAVKAYADSVGGGGASTGDITFTGSTIQSPSNADITLEPGGTGDVVMPAISFQDNLITTNRSNDDLLIGTNGTGRINISSDDSYFWGTNALYSTYFGSPDSIRTVGVNKTQTVDANTTTKQNLVGFAQNTTLSGSSTSNGNFIFRTLNMANSLDMAGYSYTQASDSKGPWAATLTTNVVNSDTTASTLYSALGSQSTVAAYDENDYSDGDLTLTNAVANQGFIEISSGGTGAGSFTFTNGYNYRTRTYVGSGDTMTNQYGFYHDTPTGAGTITNQYAFYDATNSLSVFGDIQTQAVSITDNHITTNRSNDNLLLTANGTGRVEAIESLADSTLWSAYNGTHTRIKGFAASIEDLSVDADTVGREYGHAFNLANKLTNGSSSNSNWRPRAMVSSGTVDMDGNDYTRTGMSRGPMGAQFAVIGLNSNGSTASTLENMRAVNSNAGIADFNSPTQDMTINNAFGNHAQVFIEGNGTSDKTITNAYTFYAESYTDEQGSGTASITNLYGYYFGPSTATNKYAFYDATNSLSVFGDIQTQGVSITDNLITTNKSNDDLFIDTAGTGRVYFFDKPSTLSGNIRHDHGIGSALAESIDASTQTASQDRREYNTDAIKVTLTGSGTDSDARYRGRNMRLELDPAGFSLSGTSSYGSGPMGQSAWCNVNNSTGTPTIADASGIQAGVTADGSGTLTITNAYGNNTFAEVYTPHTITNNYSYMSWLDGNGTITNQYGFYYKGNAGGGLTISNEYAFYDATNSLSVFGDIQTQGVSITDNVITSNRSNDDLLLQTAGTGRVEIGDDLANSETFSDWWFSDTNVKDLTVARQQSVDADTTGLTYNSAFDIKTTLTGGSSSNSNFRPRTFIANSSVDMAGYDYTVASITKGPVGFASSATAKNSSGSTASTLAYLRGNSISAAIADYNSPTQDITVDNAIGQYSLVAIESNGSANTSTITDAYGTYYQCYTSNTSGGTAQITNSYGFYTEGTGATNNYAFYDAGACLSRLGAVILANQASDPSGVTDSAHIYAKDVASSSEVFVRDEAGNVTQISPHNEAGEWQYWSENIKTGKKVRVNMERMIRKLEEITGETFIESE